MSTYFNNIPQPDDDPTDSQPQFLSNFQAILNAQDRNHVDFSDTGNSGRHEVVEMQQQAGNPTPVSSFASLFVRDDSGTQNLYLLDDASTEYQLTNAFTAATAGAATLPGGLEFKWGFDTAPDASSFPIVFPTPYTTATFNVQITVSKINSIGRTVMVSNGTLSTTGFTTVNNNDGNPINFFWLAIGV